MTVFLSILNQMEIHLVQNRKENCYHDHITFNVKGNENTVFSVYHAYSLETGPGDFRHHGEPIQGRTETRQTPPRYDTEAFKMPHYAETEVRAQKLPNTCNFCLFWLDRTISHFTLRTLCYFLLNLIRVYR